jgi:hypothetical protein
MGIGVEFIADEAGDELPPPPPARHRRWWPLVAALAAGTLLVWSLTRPDGHRHPQPDHAAAPTAAAPTGAAPSAAVSARAVPQCRGVPDCAVHNGVPLSIERLVHAYLPITARLRVHTVVAVNSLTLTDLLVERTIKVVHDSVTVLIRVQRGVAGTREIVHAPPGMGSLLLHSVASGYIVRLQYLAPETVPPMLGQLRQLTRDPRLESL